MTDIIDTFPQHSAGKPKSPDWTFTDWIVPASTGAREQVLTLLRRFLERMQENQHARLIENARRRSIKS
jgi:hypothetical protein